MTTFTPNPFFKTTLSSVAGWRQDEQWQQHWWSGPRSGGWHWKVAFCVFFLGVFFCVFFLVAFLCFFLGGFFVFFSWWHFLAAFFGRFFSVAARPGLQMHFQPQRHPAVPLPAGERREEAEGPADPAKPGEFQEMLIKIA